MCLNINEKRTKRVRRTLKDNGGQTVMWKRLKLKNLGYYSTSPLRGFDYKTKNILISPVEGYEYSPGDNVSNRKSTDISVIEKKCEAVYKGIHVYTNKQKALEAKSFWEVLVPVTVRLKDFVAAGCRYEAVFTKVHLSKEEYKKAIGEITCA
jgi:hypothetical protein